MKFMILPIQLVLICISAISCLPKKGRSSQQQSASLLCSGHLNAQSIDCQLAALPREIKDALLSSEGESHFDFLNHLPDSFFALDNIKLKHFDHTGGTQIATPRAPRLMVWKIIDGDVFVAVPTTRLEKTPTVEIAWFQPNTGAYQFAHISFPFTRAKTKIVFESINDLQSKNCVRCHTAYKTISLPPPLDYTYPHPAFSGLDQNFVNELLYSKDKDSLDLKNLLNSLNVFQGNRLRELGGKAVPLPSQINGFYTHILIKNSENFQGYLRGLLENVRVTSKTNPQGAGAYDMLSRLVNPQGKSLIGSLNPFKKSTYEDVLKTYHLTDMANKIKTALAANFSPERAILESIAVRQTVYEAGTFDGQIFKAGLKDLNISAGAIEKLERLLLIQHQAYSLLQDSASLEIIMNLINMPPDSNLTKRTQTFNAYIKLFPNPNTITHHIADSTLALYDFVARAWPQ